MSACDTGRGRLARLEEKKHTSGAWTLGHLCLQRRIIRRAVGDLQLRSGSSLCRAEDAVDACEVVEIFLQVRCGWW